MPTLTARPATAITGPRYPLSNSRLEPGAEHDIAAMFAALSDPTRLRLLYALAQGEMCVGDLAASIGASASSVSHHLKGLRALHLVRYRRHGKMILYSLDDGHVLTLLQVGAEHVREIHGHFTEHSLVLSEPKASASYLQPEKEASI